VDFTFCNILVLLPNIKTKPIIHLLKVKKGQNFHLEHIRTGGFPLATNSDIMSKATPQNTEVKMTYSDKNEKAVKNNSM
jgi:hypothetical protein